MEEILNMSDKEIDRYHIIKQCLAKQVTQTKAAELIGIKERQFRNLIFSYKKHGKKGLISKKRGKPSNRKYTKKFKSQIMAIVRERYPDFGPTFATEKLAEYHSIKISDETLRLWMIEERLWIPKERKAFCHPLRLRREHFGELIQIDASFHFWFEDRGQKCALIVFIDDATSKITSLHFSPSESLNAYFNALEKHLVKYGKPRALYSDRHSIFAGSDKHHNSHFIRALKELNIESLLASSPQAKGRVERANRTLQDRLIKEMRLRNISNIEDANKYLDEFLKDFNRKFSKEPRGQFDAHRPLEVGIDLERVLTRLEIRTVSNDLRISINNKYYKILEPSIEHKLKKQKVEVRYNRDDGFRLFYKDKELKYILSEEYMEKKVLDCKDKLIWNPRGGHPPKNHPWKQYGYQVGLSNRLRKMEIRV